MGYKLTLTEDDVSTIGFVAGRYCWADALYLLDIGENDIPEHEAWKIKEEFERDTEDGHSLFPMLDSCSELHEKLISFMEKIV